MTVYADLNDAPAKGRVYASKYEPPPIGQRFGTRMVIGAAPRLGQAFRWLMRCDCGAESAADAPSVIQGRASRCDGCARRNQQGAASSNWKGHGSVSSTAYCVARFSAEKRGLAWEVTIEDLSAAWDRQAGVCALSGRPMIMKRGNRFPSNASLDRRDSRRGYTPGNIQWVRVEVNMGKQQLTDAEFIELCRDVVRTADQ